MQREISKLFGVVTSRNGNGGLEQVKRLKWDNPKAFLIPGSVKPNITDKELEILRARLLLAKEIINNLKIPMYPYDVETQMVELELMYERDDTRSKLEIQQCLPIH